MPSRSISQSELIAQVEVDTYSEVSNGDDASWALQAHNLSECLCRCGPDSSICTHRHHAPRHGISSKSKMVSAA